MAAAAWRQTEIRTSDRAEPGVSVAIPTSMQFQFRNDGSEPLDIIAATMPPWPGENEAYFVDGKWEPTA